MSLRKLKRRKKRPQGNDPESARIFFEIANKHKAMGLFAKAAATYRLALEKNPQFGEAFNNLGSALHALGNFREALDCYRNASELLPLSAETLYNYGTALYENNLVDQAIETLKKVITLAPDKAEAYSSLGVALQSLGDLSGAAAALEQALAIKPDYPEAWRFLALVRKDLGDIDGARAHLTHALKQQPEDAFCRYLLSRYKKYRTPDDPDIAAITALLASGETVLYDRIFLNFALGKIYDDLGMFQEAFAHYKQANQEKRQTFNKARISTGIELGRIRRVFTPELLARFAASGSDSELPVFIVGMPRSGTSLVEQICASHSQVHGAGELKMIRELIDDNFRPDKGGHAKNLQQDYPECLLDHAPGQISKLANTHVASLKKGLSNTILRVTDKMPTNFIELGLIHILFPKARIIHCLRDPLDTCLSNFFQYFSEGNECSFDLDELALYYRKYRALMDFWQETLPGNIFSIRYEDLVSDLPTHARGLIAFLGLDWEENCLAFFSSRRPVQTASDWQVRQPIYSNSVQRWMNYEPYIGSLKRALESNSTLL